MTPLTRRQWFLVGLPLAVGGARLAAAGQGLDQFMTSAGPPCNDASQATPAVAVDGTYKAGAPARSALAGAGAAGTPLTLAGTVSGVTCGRIKGARVEIWQADARGAYDMKGFAFRGHQLTDAEGGFRFTTVVPGAPAGRAPHFGIHVVVTGKADFWTELFLPGDPHNAADRRYRPELQLRSLQAPAGRRSMAFDVVLNL